MSWAAGKGHIVLDCCRMCCQSDLRCYNVFSDPMRCVSRFTVLSDLALVAALPEPCAFAGVRRPPGRQGARALALSQGGDLSHQGLGPP